MNFSKQLACTVTHVHGFRVFLDHIESGAVLLPPHWASPAGTKLLPSSAPAADPSLPSTHTSCQNVTTLARVPIELKWLPFVSTPRQREELNKITSNRKNASLTFPESSKPSHSLSADLQRQSECTFLYFRALQKPTIHRCSLTHLLKTECAS